MGFVNLGTRNKATFWEYLSAYSFLHTQLPQTQFAITEFLGVGEGPANKHCHHTEIIEAAVETFKREFAAGLYRPEFFAAVRDVYGSALVTLEERCKKDFGSLNSAQLADELHGATAEIAETHKPMLFGLFAMYLDDFYTDMLRGAIENHVENMKPILLTTRYTSFGQQEEDALFAFEQNFLEHGGTQEGFVKFCEASPEFAKIVNDFGWFHMEYSGEPMTASEYMDYMWERIASGRKIDDPAPWEQRADILSQQSQFFADHPEATELREWTRVLQEMARILDDSKVITVRGIFTARPLFQEAARRLDVSLSDMLYLVLPEIVELLKHEAIPDPKLIAERKAHRAVLLENGSISVYEGGTAAEIAARLLPEEVGQSAEVRGITAYPGLVRGRVSIINSPDDRAKFKPGDILVTRDGTVELTVFLREAAAIVTDEGGMICHAAIVAREMKTPCVVGTRNATKSYKDGDLVEVDAAHGVVRKLDQ